MRLRTLTAYCKGQLPYYQARHAVMREGLLPFRQLGLRHSLEEFRPDGHNALEGAKLAVCRRGMDGSETRNRSPAARNDDLLAGLDPLKKFGKIGLRGVHGDGGHEASRLVRRLSQDKRAHPPL